MTRKNPPTRWALPINPTPDKTVCFEVAVPDDPMYIAAFIGSIYELSKAYAWENDAAHTALTCASVWLRVFDNLHKCREISGAQGGADGGDENMIRQNPDNPCELQTSIDGTHWCTFADLSLCTPSSPQPGDGSKQPAPGGGSECYKAQLDANGYLLIPFPVNTGDILTINTIAGAGSDGNIAHWQCPSGDDFFAGACVGGSAKFDGADPLTTAYHMRIIWKLGSNFYDAMGGPFTVPSGVTGVQPILQVNDSNLADNSGNYQVEVCVQNNTGAAWAIDIDFALDVKGWVTTHYNTGENKATYVGGSGWQAQAVKTDDGSTTPRYMYLQIKRDFAVFTTITKFSITYNETLGGNAGGSTLVNQLHYHDGGGNHLLTSNTPATANGQTLTDTTSHSADGLQITCFIDDAGAGNTGGGAGLVYHAHIEGVGTNPFI